MKIFYCLFLVFLISTKTVFGCPNLSWNDILKFFDFSTIEQLQTKNSFENNVKRLLNEQLKLLSGQHLWAAFLYLETECNKYFSFKFIFETNNSLGANIVLDKYQIDENAEKKVFYFKITFNKMFLENTFSEEDLIEKNVLCRPCLIKLNGCYYLKEQKLPFFITLAHEFLHALNQLERIQHLFFQNKFDEKIFKETNNIRNYIDALLPIQSFLQQKLRVDSNDLCLQEKYKKLWQNYNLDDSLDEMTVILGSNRKIKKCEEVFVGETTFLQDYYGDENIVPWSHFSAYDLNLWMDIMPILLEEQYVDSVLKLFSIPTTNIKNYPIQCDFCKKFCVCWGNSFHKVYFLRYLRDNVRFHFRSEIKTELFYKLAKSDFCYNVKIYPIKENSVFLPSVSKITNSTESLMNLISIKNYKLVNVPADGNCAFTSVKVALGDKDFSGDIKNLNNDQKDAIAKLRSDTADEMSKFVEDNSEFLNRIRQLGFWNSGIDGAVGIEVLSYVAQVINRPILVVTEYEGNYRYWVSGAIGNPRNDNLVFHDIDVENLESVLDRYPDAIKLFHNGIHFQAIIKADVNLPTSSGLKA